MSKTYKIAAFYQFADMPDRDQWADALVQAGLDFQLAGTIIIAYEGINSTLSGTPDNIDRMIALLREDARFAHMNVKYSYADFVPFARFKVKRKDEIVTFRQSNADPRKKVGTYVEPSQWNELIADPEVLTIDTRNDYEVKVGKFAGALNPNTDDFTEFADFVREHMSASKKQKVAMYCTGGIRCERATAWLLEEGFEEVYHLKGGILNYLEKVPEDEQRWEGDCFVFDYRVAVDHKLEPANWVIDPETGDPVPIDPAQRAHIDELRKSGAIFQKPYRI